MVSRLKTVQGVLAGLLLCFAFFNKFSSRPSDGIKSRFKAQKQTLSSPSVKHYSKNEIHLLREQILYDSHWNNDSVVPEKFFQNSPNISKHDYRWMINPARKCQSDVFLLVVIGSASWEFERRLIIRQTWAENKEHDGQKVEYVFFLGNHKKTPIEKLEKENEKHHDIVVEDFEETYKNLTLKTQGQLKWMTHFCPKAKYVMHVDDDVFVDVSRIVNHLIPINEERFDVIFIFGLLFCGKIFMPTVRREGKWKMSQEDYSGKQYPKSCIGWCYVMSQRVAHDLFYSSLNTPLIHLEDVTFTGILREKINVILRKLPDDKLTGCCKHLGWPKDIPVNEKLWIAWDEFIEDQD